MDSELAWVSPFAFGDWGAPSLWDRRIVRWARVFKTARGRAIRAPGLADHEFWHRTSFLLRAWAGCFRWPALHHPPRPRLRTAATVPVRRRQERNPPPETFPRGRPDDRVQSNA